MGKKKRRDPASGPAATGNCSWVEGLLKLGCVTSCESPKGSRGSQWTDAHSPVPYPPAASANARRRRSQARWAAGNLSRKRWLRCILRPAN